MQFSDTTNKYNGLIQRCEMTTNLGDTGISGDSYLLQTFTGLLNDAVYKVESWIREVSNVWADEQNQSTQFPLATTTLVDGQRDYSSIFAKIINVEVMDNGGNYYSLDYWPDGIKKISDPKWQETAGLPTKYYLFGDSIILHPKPSASSVTLAKGLRVAYEKEATLFTASSTDTDAPFNVKFHPALFYLACMNWAADRNAVIYNNCRLQIYGDGGRDRGYKNAIQKEYSKPTVDVKPKIRLKSFNNLIR